MDASTTFEDGLEEAVLLHAAQERAYDELLARHGLTREAVARAGEGRYLPPRRRALLAAAKAADDEEDGRPGVRDQQTVPPHAVPV